MILKLGGQLRRWRELLKHREELKAVCRFRFTRNALPFTVQTLKGLPAFPQAALKRLVLFAHYDPLNEVDDYVCHYLKSIYELGSTIIFVSGAANLSSVSAEKIHPYCAGIFTRRTLSLDFGSWHLAWQHLLHRGWKLTDFDSFVLANDSVYGPLFPLNEMFDTFNGADMYGVTESNERGNHLQSYLLAWELNESTSRFIHAFWKSFQYVVLKQDLIDKYEIGISKQAKAAGLRLKAFVPDKAVRDVLSNRPNHEFAGRLSREHLNNSILFWDILIEVFRCPLLKTSVPRFNLFDSEKVISLEEELRSCTDYDWLLIKGHLERLGLFRGPPDLLHEVHRSDIATTDVPTSNIL